MFENLSILELMSKGGTTMFVLGICFIISIAIIIERLWYFSYVLKFSGRNIEKFINTMKECFKNNSTTEVIARCEEDNSILAKVLKESLKRLSGYNRPSKDEIRDTINESLQIEVLEMEKYLKVIFTIAIISPLIGLFTTVIGIMKVLYDFSVTTGLETTAISGGISETLTSTAFGLFISIIAVIAYNYFTGKIRKISKNIEVVLSDLSNHLNFI